MQDAAGLADVVTLRFDGRAVPLRVEVNRRARRISLRLSCAQSGIVLVLPSRRALREGLAFAESRRRWILGHLDALPQRIPFEPGVSVPLLGHPHLIEHRPGERLGGVRLSEERLLVSGAPEHVPRRVGDFLKTEARRELSQRAHRHAERLGRRVVRVGVRDTRSRWGSCSPSGALSFSWRLILAPEAVLDYVVAHEAAHLVEMNHGARFWGLVEQLCPEHDPHRAWLARNGRELHRYG